MELIGYFASALIGLSLGLTGSGGSILTVPVLVYLFHIEPTLATAYSLFIVGVTSLVGAVRSMFGQGIDHRKAAVFAVPSFIAVYLTRRLLIPLIPLHLFTVNGFTVTRELALMVFFALLMLAASVAMIRSRKTEASMPPGRTGNSILIALDGTAVGLVTGTVGAGGGFLIIPALVLLAKVPMKKAIGTSLLIIAANSLIGFAGDINAGRTIDFPFILLLSALATGGIFIGSYLAQFTDGQKLKTAFGWFVLGMGVAILVKEILFLQM
jgi:uncharacterized membrane protein YfcA